MLPLQVIVWINLSQDPEIMLLQCKAYEQLTGNEKISDKYKTSVNSQLIEMKKAAEGKVVLMVRLHAKRSVHLLVILQVIDDVWAIEFANAFACVDPENSSKMLLTTRIKGLIAKGTEVELELLGLKASVELLANVAQLDTDQVPPICLEIAQLCGKLQIISNEIVH